MNVNIRTATTDDITILAALGTTTCYEAYFELDPSADLADYCERIYSVENVRAEFEDANSTYLIAEVDDRAVGFAKLRENNSVECMSGKNAIELHRIYLLERLKGSGIGRELFEQCCIIGRGKNYDELWLGVWGRNLAAQKFYQRLGMTSVGTTVFNDGKNDFINLVYALHL
ncbi:MAG TPA: GNAT family N-acetyltransferase [Pyrinomonadaceae bacterium]|nr:GNAT family N-acetyltransferase [Pyrinomonadaceae bacterium]